MMGNTNDDIRRVLEQGIGRLFEGADLLRNALRDPPKDALGETVSRMQLDADVIGSMADALEARWRAQEAGDRMEEHARKRAEEGWAGEEDLEYDFAAFGMHTVKTFLELNAKANRRMVQALRAAAKARGSSEAPPREPAEAPTAPVRVLIGPPVGHAWVHAGDFEVINRRGSKLWLELGKEGHDEDGRPIRGVVDLDVSPLGGGDSRPIRLRMEPSTINLDAGGSTTIKIWARGDAASSLDHHTWIGKLIPAKVYVGSFSTVPVFVEVAKPAPQPLDTAEAEDLVLHFSDGRRRAVRAPLLESLRIPGVHLVERRQKDGLSQWFYLFDDAAQAPPESPDVGGP